MEKMPLDQLINILELSLKELIEKDSDLIERQVHENSINHRFAIYLENHLPINYKTEKNLSVDVEYNRNHINPKYIYQNDRKQSIRPDILIHERNSNDNNFLFIEAKRKTISPEDLIKLKAVLDQNSVYKYDYSLSIEYSSEIMSINIYQLQNGSITKERLFFSKKEKNFLFWS